MIVTRAPLRVSLLGGGTDFEDFYKEHGGAVLSMAINKYVYVILKDSYDDKYHLRYSHHEDVEHILDIKHDLMRECLLELNQDRVTPTRSFGPCKKLDIVTMADVPSTGTGLGSSSAITVALLQALHKDLEKGDHYFTKMGYGNMTPEELAEEACLVEIGRLHKPIGKQDQYASAYGGLNFITFNDKIEVQRLSSCPALVDNLLLFYTGQGRDSGAILSHWQANLEAQQEYLCQLRRMAYRGFNAYLHGEFDEIGSLIGESWKLKKAIGPQSTTPEIDRIYARAMEVGALGGKVCGAGGGGCILFYVPKDRQDDVRQAVDLQEIPFALSESGSTVIYDDKMQEALVYGQDN